MIQDLGLKKIRDLVSLCIPHRLNGDRLYVKKQLFLHEAGEPLERLNAQTGLCFRTHSASNKIRAA